MALTLDDDQAARLLELLGLPADTSDIDLVLATVEDLANQTSAPKPSDVAASAKAHGLEVIDADTLTALRNDAAEGRRLVVAAAQQRITAAVDKAVARGAITPARREHWIKLASADEAMLDVLASTPDETAVALTEMGHGVDSDGPHGGDADAWFR
ncbi:hypothetical protein MSIMFI_03790 [Mycobacterium simulans]|uniref:hypothetical protein n=1 Tax=Mycobacterium simulans TaxID=627089 RepID=UPI00174C7955|nr:hypothetical protein [Mycobacterium simulans]SON62265.1 hypothetical protein MSIMFI_03790 [Mycobacterium simulans]